MKQILRIIQRESARKALIGGKVQAYWGPRGIARLLGRIGNVITAEGPAGIFSRFRRIAGRTLGEEGYARWAVDRQLQLAASGKALTLEAERLSWRPTISILLPVENGRVEWLEAAIGSVLGQYYRYWELCIAVDERTDGQIRTLLDNYATREDRIKVSFGQEYSDISGVENACLAVATGEYVCLMGHDDLIAADALLLIARKLNADPSLDMVYSDEDRIDAAGKNSAPFFKPDWSPDYLECFMYTGRLSAYRKAIVDRIGGFRPGMRGAEHYDFVLRYTEQSDRVGHVPEVLYHRRAVMGPAAEHSSGAGFVRALQDRLARHGQAGMVSPSSFSGCFEVRYTLPRDPHVSIVIPSAGGDRVVRGERVNLVSRCVERIRDLSTYSNYDVVIVDNGDLRPEVKAILQRLNCSFVTFTEPVFNISKKLNLGVAHARGEFVLLLNDDIEIISKDWIEALLEQATKPGVGVVGAKLLYEDGSIQHAGIAHHDGLPDHVRKFYPRKDAGYYFSTAAVRNYLAVTGACMLTPADVYRRVGGFAEEYKVNYSDIDYCLKVRELGLRTVYTPYAELYHYESASREAVVEPDEKARYLERWASVTDPDPYYNARYLDTSPPDFSVNIRRIAR